MMLTPSSATSSPMKASMRGMRGNTQPVDTTSTDNR